MYEELMRQEEIEHKHRLRQLEFERYVCMYVRVYVI